MLAPRKVVTFKKLDMADFCVFAVDVYDRKGKSNYNGLSCRLPLRTIQVKYSTPKFVI